jgi:hypothetical protein
MRGRNGDWGEHAKRAACRRMKIFLGLGFLFAKAFLPTFGKLGTLAGVERRAARRGPPRAPVADQQQGEPS